MPWVDVDIEKMAKDLGLNLKVIDEKHRIIKTLVKLRKSKGLTQTVLAKKAGLSQSRIAQIESGIGTRTITFDILFNLLTLLGGEYQIKTTLSGHSERRSAKT